VPLAVALRMAVCQQSVLTLAPELLELTLAPELLELAVPALVALVLALVVSVSVLD
jgi:hypothetical protein